MTSTADILLDGDHTEHLTDLHFAEWELQTARLRTGREKEKELHLVDYVECGGSQLYYRRNLKSQKW